MCFENLEDAITYFRSARKHCLEIWVETCFPEGLFCSQCECYIHEMPHHGNGRRIDCPDCSNRMTVFAGSVIEHSDLNLATWFAIIWNAVSKKPCSGHHLASALGCSYYDVRDAIKSVDAVKTYLRKHSYGYRRNKFLAIVRGCMGAHENV